MRTCLRSQTRRHVARHTWPARAGPTSLACGVKLMSAYMHSTTPVPALKTVLGSGSGSAWGTIVWRLRMDVPAAEPGWGRRIGCCAAHGALHLRSVVHPSPAGGGTRGLAREVQLLLGLARARRATAWTAAGQRRARCRSLPALHRPPRLQRERHPCFLPSSGTARWKSACSDEIAVFCNRARCSSVQVP
jgi:hypothetical protein